MKDKELSRRDFGKLTAAALGGAIAGATLGQRALHAAATAADGGTGAPPPKDAHICCGLNSCKGKGKAASNSCAGTGSCATVASHGCAGQNACAEQGPTGDNACKGKGGCAVPVSGDGWKKLRSNWEASMTKAGKKFGPAPKECAGGA